MPGTYHETVYVDKDDIRIIGVIEEGRRAVLDGQKKLNDAILYSGNNFVAENLEIRNYKGNGIMGQAGNNFEIRNNVIAESGVYGIFPQLGQNGIVEHNVVSGIADAAIYIGMSDNILVAHNDVFDSVAGIEIENSRHAIVEHNYVHNNSGGLLAFVTPGLPIKDTVDVIFRNNFVVGNNHANFGAPGSTVAGIPAGTGILVMAADDVVIEGNVISDNKVSGIIITDHAHASNITADPESDPNSDRVKILENVMLRNGYDTITEAKALVLAEGKVNVKNLDIARVGPSPGSCIINRHQYVTVGVSDFADCEFTNTATTVNYLLPPVPPREIKPGERGRVVYLGICTGCHTYNGRMIGPPVQVIQALYMENPQGLADYIAKPREEARRLSRNASAGLSRSRDAPRGGEIHARSDQLKFRRDDQMTYRRNKLAYAVHIGAGRCGARGRGCPVLPWRRTLRRRKSEEITVTAQLRAQSLQDVPIAMQVVDRALIEDVAAEDMSDLNGFVPGLVVSGDSPTQPRYQIRGIQTGDFGVGTDPAVGVYVDGIYAARSGASMLAFNDIERIEVLKGPQGTLFGRNSAAGAISIVTTQPSHEFDSHAAWALRRVWQAVLRRHDQHANRREARAAHQRRLQQE